MKKYRVTEKHKLLKDNIILEHGIITGTYFSSVWAHEFSNDEIKDWIENGWVEEIQEKEFTKDDMIKFANWANKCDVANVDHEGYLCEWIRNQKNKNEN